MRRFLNFLVVPIKLVLILPVMLFVFCCMLAGEAVKEWKRRNSNPTLLNVEQLASKMWKEVDRD